MRKSPEARARQMKAWTMAYPSECLLNTIDIFLTIEFGVNSADLKVPTCVMYNPSDPIVCLESFKKVLQAAPSISYLKVADSEEPHNLTGNLMSPSTVDRCSRHFIDFLHANLK
uniref:Peptidase S9 prolyl oligopeptidase catalytic domain-containing protein n=2 Tax=Chrysotila carterae TaxID=13221 RepID=A0A7S4B3B6_CHRCT